MTKTYHSHILTQTTKRRKGDGESRCAAYLLKSSERAARLTCQEEECSKSNMPDQWQRLHTIIIN